MGCSSIGAGMGMFHCGYRGAIIIEEEIEEDQ
jgi:hypothetical protein